jgi:hypothetical protein
MVFVTNNDAFYPLSFQTKVLFLLPLILTLLHPLCRLPALFCRIPDTFFLTVTNRHHIGTDMDRAASGTNPPGENFEDTTEVQKMGTGGDLLGEMKPNMKTHEGKGGTGQLHGSSTGENPLRLRGGAMGVNYRRSIIGSNLPCL